MPNKCTVLFELIIKKIRLAFNKFKAFGISKDVSVFSNDCVGGVMCHDLGLRFLSPTVNLYFETDNDYLEFLSDIKYYCQALPRQIFQDKKDYPIGEIRKGDKRVIIHFLHYKTFQEAISKWQERGKRVNYDNMIVIWHVPNTFGPSYNDLNRFLDLNFKKAMIITGKNCNLNSKIICKLSLYSKGNYYSGKIFNYKSPFCIVKYLDQTRYWKLFKKQTNIKNHILKHILMFYKQHS